MSAVFSGHSVLTWVFIVLLACFVELQLLGNQVEMWREIDRLVFMEEDL